MAASDKRIVIIALDKSKQAEYAANYYLDFLHRPGNSLIFVHIVELPQDAFEARRVSLTPLTISELWKEEEEKTKELFKKFKDLAESKGVTETKLRIEGGMKPGHVITEIATEEKACMVVLGTRGMGTLRRTIMGSVSDYVVHHCHCPVVVCRK